MPSNASPLTDRSGNDHQSKAAEPLSSTELFGAAREIAIDHAGTLYRLRITRQGKLILNK